MRRLAHLGRVIHFDRRGTGLSDPMPVDGLPDLRTQVEDAAAVMQAAGSEEACIVGINDGTIIALHLAESSPDRCRSLVLFTLVGSHDFGGRLSLGSIDEVVDLIETQALSGESGVELLAPSRAGDEAFDEQLARLQRHSVRPGVFGHYYRQTMQTDVSALLPRVRTPTLVLNRSGNRIVTVEQSREAAAAIEGARFVELPGTDHLIFSEGIDPLVEEIEEFLTGSRSGADPDRVLATLMFTDIVGSTSLAATMGDRRWRDLLDRNHELARAEIQRFGGDVVSTTGDGHFARFERPVAAVRCALSLTESVSGLGLEIRAGVHMGEVEVRGEDLGGLAVHIASRITDLAGPGEVLVSSTVRELLAGSDMTFADRDGHELKGMPGSWHLFAASLG
jgi:class 3 adenylate cyclase